MTAPARALLLRAQSLRGEGTMGGGGGGGNDHHTGPTTSTIHRHPWPSGTGMETCRISDSACVRGMAVPVSFHRILLDGATPRGGGGGGGGGGAGGGRQEKKKKKKCGREIRQS